MTKQKAKQLKYCDHCAAFYGGRQYCGVLRDPGHKDQCGLGEDIIERWKREHGLERTNPFTKTKPVEDQTFEEIWGIPEE